MIFLFTDRKLLTQSIPITTHAPRLENEIDFDIFLISNVTIIESDSLVIIPYDETTFFNSYILASLELGRSVLVTDSLDNSIQIDDKIKSKGITFVNDNSIFFSHRSRKIIERQKPLSISIPSLKTSISF